MGKRLFSLLTVLGIIFGCAPQGPSDFMNIPEPSEYMRGFFPLKVVFDNKKNNEMVILMGRGGGVNEMRLLAISMPLGQKLWEYSITNQTVKDVAPDPEGGVWVFVEDWKTEGRRRVRDFKLLKIVEGKNTTSVDIPDTIYTDWYSFVVTKDMFIGKPVSPALYFGACSRLGDLIKAAPKFKSLRDYYNEFKKYSSAYNFRKFVAVSDGKMYYLSEALDTMEIYDIENESLISKVYLGKPQIIPKGPGKAVILNRVMSVGTKGDTLWVLTLKDIRYYYDGKLIYAIDFGDKRFLAGAVKNDTFYWITYDKAVRLAAVSRYKVLKAEEVNGER
ncbi:MAG: hypothetical protein ABIL27_04565 [candidate division WOR-3 bacterium]